MTLTPEYFGSMTTIGCDDAHQAALAEVALILSGKHGSEMVRRGGVDEHGLNQLIDALLDKVIATSGGDIRLALFFALSSLGWTYLELRESRAS